MKLIKKLILLSLVVVSCTHFFTGCAYHKYELVGIVKEGDSTITPLSEISDETIKTHLMNNYQNWAYIELNQDNTFEMGWTKTDNCLSIDYTISGTFELNEKENTINFTTQTSSDKTDTANQQYLNGAIIYYDGVVFLAFK